MLAEKKTVHYSQEAKQSISSKRNLMVTKETESKQCLVTENVPMACSKALTLLSVLEHLAPSELLQIAPKVRKDGLVLEPRPLLVCPI